MLINIFIIDVMEAFNHMDRHITHRLLYDYINLSDYMLYRHQKYGLPYCS